MLGFVDIAVKRTAAGSYVAGVWVPGAETDLTVSGSVQPLNGNETLRLPEGQRERARFKLYTKDELQLVSVADATAADRVVYRGVEMVVDAFADYTPGIPGSSINHRKYVLLAPEVSA